MFARPIGVLRMRDQDQLDQKILAVPVADPRFDDVNDLSDLQEHWPREIENFFNTLKVLEGKETRMDGWGNSDAARRLVRSCSISRTRRGARK